MVEKLDRGLQLCVDFHILNKTTVHNQFLLPFIDDLVDSLAKSKAYSGLNLRSRYWKVCMAEESIEYIVFIMQSGQY